MENIHNSPEEEIKNIEKIETEEELIELYKNGTSLRQLQRQSIFSYHRITKVINKAGIMRPRTVGFMNAVPVPVSDNSQEQKPEQKSEPEQESEIQLGTKKILALFKKDKAQITRDTMIKNTGLDPDTFSKSLHELRQEKRIIYSPIYRSYSLIKNQQDLRAFWLSRRWGNRRRNTTIKKERKVLYQ